MTAAAIAQLLEALASVTIEAYSAYEASQTVISATDAKTIHEALLAAEDATAQLRPKVDAALAAAAAK